MMTMESPVSREHTAAASASAKELASRLEAAERIPVQPLSFADLISLNDLAVGCGGELLRLRASIFAEQRHHDEALVQSALRHDRDVSATNQMCAEQREIAIRDFKAAKEVISRKAAEEYETLCKRFNEKLSDFTAMKLAMPRTPSFSEATSSENSEIGLARALSDWDSQMITRSPGGALYGWSYAGATLVFGFMLENLFAGLVPGAIVPVAIYLLFIKSQLKLQKLRPALASDGARIAKRTKDPIEAARMRMNVRCEELDARLAKELAELEDRQSRVLNGLKSDHESVMSQLKQSAYSLDEEMLGLFDRVKRLEVAWQTENRQSVAPLSGKPMDWEVPAPRLLRLGSLSLTSQGLIQRAS